MENLKLQIAQALNEDANLNTLQLAAKFQVPEGLVLKNIPEEFVTILPKEKVEDLLNDLPTWGVFTTIIEKEGSIFEIKGPFPTGVFGRGYYNLNMGPTANPEIALHGHLKLDVVSEIALISKPFNGKESYNIAFLSETGNVVFKVYLGRDENRRLFPEQVERFKALANNN